MSTPDNLPRVLCLACSPTVFASLNHALSYSNLHVLSAATRDSGVAVCIAEVIAVAILDGESIRGKEGSVAKSLRKVQPRLPIILLEERVRTSDIPEGIDVVVRLGDTGELLTKIEELLNLGGTKARAAG
jgi:DNA-binding response OmpR family regulator